MTSPQNTRIRDQRCSRALLPLRSSFAPCASSRLFSSCLVSRPYHSKVESTAAFHSKGGMDRFLSVRDCQYSFTRPRITYFLLRSRTYSIHIQLTVSIACTSQKQHCSIYYIYMCSNSYVYILYIYIFIIGYH